MQTPEEKAVARAEYMREYRKRNPEKWVKTPEKRARHNAARREKYAAEPERREAALAAAKDYRVRNPDRRKLTMYGLDAYDLEILTDVGCAICHAQFAESSAGGGARRHIDHDHRTGKTRGLLCQQCNLALGHLGDDPIVAAAAFRYLMNGGDSALVG